MNFTEGIWCIFIGALLTGIGKVFWTYRKEAFLWLKKQRLKLFPVGFNVAFSIESGGEISESYLREIKKNLDKIVVDLGLSEKVKIVDISDSIKFSSSEEAEKFKFKKELDLVVWGSFSSDNLKQKGKKLNLIDLKFTYGKIDNGSGNLGKMILTDIESAIGQKTYWRVLEEESLSDLEVISNNISDLSIYIIALTLVLYGKVEESVNMFEKLRESLSAKKEDSFLKRVTMHLKSCYGILIINSGIRKKNFPSGIKFCKKILKIDKKNLFAITNLAKFQYEIGEKKNSEENVDLMLELYPNNSLTEVNVAFIRILQKKYKNAFKHYEKLIKMKEIRFNALSVVEFLDIEYDRIKEPAFLYGKGIISYYWGDKKIAREDLEKFVKENKGDSYKRMERRAKNILKKYQ